MIRGAISLAIVIGLAIASYGAYFHISAIGQQTGQHAGNTEDLGLHWLRSEFGLSNEAFAAIERESDQYLPRCRDMCRQLGEARNHMANLVDSPDSKAPEIESAYARVSEIEQQCFQMSLRHIYAVASLMEPVQGHQYRKQMVKVLMGYRSGHHRLHSDIGRSKPTTHGMK
jgi:hypothetical protein